MKLRCLCILLSGALAVSGTGCAKVQLPKAQEEPSSRLETGQGAAESPALAERLGVPKSVEGEFQSESGISRVTVNANVVVPEVNQADIVEALPRAFTPEEVSSVASRYQDDVGWYYVQGNSVPYGGGQPSLAYSANGIDMYSLWIHNIPFPAAFSPDTDRIQEIKSRLTAKQAESYVFSSLNVNYGLSRETGKIGFTPELEYIRSNERVDGDMLLPLTDGKAADCTISLEEAISLANAEVHALAPDYQVSAYGQTPVLELGSKRQDYILRYTRHLKGIPVNDSYGGEGTASNDGHVSGLGVITVVVQDSGVCLLQYHNPYDVGDTVQENVELLPFQDIWDIFSSLSLLSIQRLEIDKDLQKNDLEVYEIRFGYMTVLQADGSYQYTPVWDFYGRRYLAGTGAYGHAHEFQPIEGCSELTINAIDGTVINRDLGY